MTQDQLLLNLSSQELSNLYQEINHKFESATSEQDLDDVASEIDKYLESGNHEINKYIASNAKTFQTELNNVEVGRAKLSETININEDLTKLFSHSNDLGNILTIELKSLDKELNRINEAKQYVVKTKLLKNNINQAVYALEHNNVELAAKCINTVNHEIPTPLITSNYASLVVPSTDIPELPQTVIDNSISQLTKIFEIKFSEAANNKNIADLTKYFQLFPLIGKEEVGLNCYSKFICQIITDSSRNLIKSITSELSKKPGIYSQITMQLFENISIMLSQHAPLIKRHYSSTYPNAINYVINKIQHEIDSQIGLITDSFYDQHRIDKVLQDIKIYNFPILTKRHADNVDNLKSPRQSFDDNEVVTIVESGDYFNELAGIFNYWSLYCKFITVRYFNQPHQTNDLNNEVNGGVKNTNDNGHDNNNKLRQPDIILNSNFTKKIQSKYLPAFESIFKYYFKRSLEKSIIIEELPSIDQYLLSNINHYPETPPVSSVIEDLSLVLNTCLRGIIDSSQVECIKNFVTESFKVLQVDFLNSYLIKQLNDNLPRYNLSLNLINSKNLSSKLLSNVGSPRSLRGATPQPESTGMGFLKGATSAFGNVVGSTSVTPSIIGSGDDDINGATNVSANNPRLVNFVIYLNTIALSQDYFHRIISNFLKDDCRYIKNSFPFGDDSEIVKTILTEELLTPFVSITNRIIQEALINFYNQSIKSKILTIISEFLSDHDDTNFIIYSPSLLNDTSIIYTFINNWKNLIKPYKQVFHHELIFNKLLKLIILNVANIVEKRLIHVLKKFKINELGSLKLEKDVSSFISEVCEDNYELREKFVRVTQLILLVGMDQDEYEESIHDHDDELGINWVLTQQERKEFRKLRI